ncbi:hypothetical protein DFH06DRAFT_1208963 [Mycena polygramma]|nr:hypothetical protein DFH06DRAFT_1208963 [Mycena polygramma]
MHISLCRERLDDLPSHKRVLATMAMHDSVPSLRGLVESVKFPCDEMHFLPVFFHHLDQGKIPSENVMHTESLPDDTVSIIACAFLSLKGLFELSLPPSSSRPALWTRVWPWIQFLDVYHSQIPDAPTLGICRTCFFSLIGNMVETPNDTSRHIVTTPGVGILAAQVWSSGFRNQNDTLTRTISHLARFLVMAIDCEYDFTEFVEGAGGTDILAVLVVRLVHGLVESADIPVRTALNLLGLVIFASKYDDNDTWTSTLRAHQYLPALISVLFFAIHFLQGATAKGIYSDLFDQTWVSFYRLLVLSPGRGYISTVEAIDAGVLTVIVSLVNKHADKVIAGYRLQTFLAKLSLRSDPQ